MVVFIGLTFAIGCVIMPAMERKPHLQVPERDRQKVPDLGGLLLKSISSDVQRRQNEALIRVLLLVGVVVGAGLLAANSTSSIMRENSVPTDPSLSPSPELRSPLPMPSETAAKNLRGS